MSDPPTTIINVSNRLPITVSADGAIHPSAGGLVAALQGVSADKFTLQWVGWPGNDVSPEKQADLAARLHEAHRLTPVFLDAAEAEAHYEGFSNASLWPLLHYMPGKFRYEAGWWEAYETVNRRFADAVLSIVKRGDELVWVHDYHLLLLPRMLREARPGLRVGFFLHTPFPSFEVFRCHPRRAELVEGVLGADLIGFHTFGYLRHFRSTATRLLDVEAEVTGIRTEGGHLASLGVHPIGIHSPRFVAEMGRPEFRQTLEHLRHAHGGKRVVLSVERLDYSKGLLQRLDAIELFLRDTGSAERMRFIFVAVPSRENVAEYRQLVEEVEQRVGQINGRHGTIANSPLQFVHGSVEFTELCALYALAEVALVTPVRDGMNLVAKEYVACQAQAPGVQPGVLILSEFAGAAEVLFDALVVNPYDVRATADALRAALAMPMAERAARMGAMRDRVMRFDAAWWARSFVESLARESDTSAQASAKTARSDPAELLARLREVVAAGGRVGLFLDYDGTLREITRDPAAAAPTGELLDLLRHLHGRANVATTIISGRRPEDLDGFFGTSFPGFAIVAEHGASLRRAGSADWEQLDRNATYRWKEPVERILRFYESTTPGSFVEEKRTSLVWHFRRTDPEFGGWKVRQLVAELASVTANQPLSVQLGRKIVEVTPSVINKGAAVLRLLEESAFDVVLAAGDDTTDESMFALEVPNLLTVNVGGRPTQAQFVLPNPARLRRLLMEAF